MPGEIINVEARSSSSDQFWTMTRFAIFLILVLVAAFPLVSIGSHTFFYRDFGAMWYPVNVYTRDSLLSGEIPLWNPYIHCGVPFQAQMGQWYPPLLAAVFLPMPWSMNVLLLVHLAWAGVGTFWLARRWGAGSFAAAFAGVAYVFNGVTLSSLLWISYIACLAWLPWVVGSVVEVWTKGGRWFVLASICSALQVLTGMPELTAMTWLFLLLLWLGALITKQFRLLPSAARTAGVITLAAGLTMVQMLPFFDLLSHSQRNIHYATDTWSMPSWGWANLLVPLFHCYRSPQGLWFQAGQDLLPSYYLGAAVLVLSFVAILMTRDRRKWVILIMLLFCWIMALGSHGGLYDLLRGLFPQIGFVRYPIKFAIFPAFLVPLLAASAIDRLNSRDKTKPRRLLLVSTAAVIFLMGVLILIARAFPLEHDVWQNTATNTFWRVLLMAAIVAGMVCLQKLADPRQKIALQLSLLLVLPVDALTHCPNIAPTQPSSVMAQGMWEASGKSTPPKLGQGRIMLSAAAEMAFNRSYVEKLGTDFIGKRLGEWYNLNLLDRVPKVNGALPLHPEPYDFLENHLYYKSGARYGPALLDFLSVAWISSDQNVTDWTPRTNYLPLITAGQLPVFASVEQTMEAMTADDFRPKSFVYLPEAARSLVGVTNATTCAITNISFLPNKVQVDTDSEAAAMLVVSQTYFHLWQAFVDGHPVPLFRANIAFQALEVPAGKHHVEIVYTDHNLLFGALLTAISLGLCALLWLKSPPGV